MVHCFPRLGGVRYGPSSTRLRHNDGVRRAIQHSQESLRSLSKRYGINQKTVAKWKKRSSTADLKTGPKEPRSTILSVEDEAVIVAFRRHTLLPLDDCLYALQPTIPHLTRSSLHRCLQRNGINRLPDFDGDKPTKKKFKAYPIGFSISISPRYRPPRASYTFTWPLISRANSPSCRSLEKPAAPRRPPSSWP